MRILASAQPFGFGPVAQLVGMARQLAEIRASVAKLATLFDGVPIGNVVKDVMKDLQ